ncbi:BREX-1 system phosphatase PglZ type A [Chromobacterium subtsugae]|uniref:BREX-1 system phosphatase PglZ type A n=1 Tax=Chromobacterium subtsugae TaxID=251747 RepID=UPI000B17F2AB|nr:BREX-1 system phosphatase PglZ type A [Chromobacterium subtsugae]
MATAELGYDEKEPSLRDLAFHLFVTDLARAIDGEVPGKLAHFVLPDPVKAATASVFLSQWRSNINHFASYNTISSAVAEALQLQQEIASQHAENLLDVMTFAEVEKRIIQDLRDRIAAGAGASLDAVREIFSRRRDGHWANPKLAANNALTQAFVACYDALDAAADLFGLQAAHAAGFSFGDSVAAIEAYRSELFRFDQGYRHFHYAASQVEPMGWGLLHSLRDRVEEMYSGWFVPQLASAWSKILESEAGLLKHWQIPGWLNQTQFFAREVNPLLQSGGLKRVFVVISDAFRFEAAEELCRDINSRNRFKASLSGMLGVLPSYTTLGMASLLPHQTLAYKLNANLDVLADGQPVSTTEQRNAHLARYDGMAIKWEELFELGKEKGRERVKDARVVYVYHDRIDMLGDKAVSETKTFEAVSDTLKELNDLIGFLINNLNASTVLVTADHGFLYQEAALDISDKSTLEIKPEGVIKSKKRYILGEQLGENDKVWHGSTAVTAGTEPAASLDFWVPKGATRFHFAGGARFVHGSAMPQEIVVPMLTVKVSESEKAKVSTVNIAPLLMTNKVVANLQRFEFIQTEPVSTRLLPRSVTLSLRDGEALISDEQTVTFDSPSSSMDERKKSVLLTVRAGSYDRLKDYFLVVRDVQTKVELHRIAMKIDLALANDF